MTKQHRNKVAECVRRVQEAEHMLASTRALLVELADEEAAEAQEHSAEPQPDCWGRSGATKRSTRPRAEHAALPNGSKDECTSPSESSRPMPRSDLPKEHVDRCSEVFKRADAAGKGRVAMGKLQELLQEVFEQEIPITDMQRVLLSFPHAEQDSFDMQEFMHAYSVSPLVCRGILCESTDPNAIERRKVHDETPEEHMRRVGVKSSSVMRFLKKEIKEANACLQLPGVVLMFVLYYLAVHFHYPLQRLHAMDKAVYFDILENANFAFTGILPFENGRMGHKNFDDVNSFADFWSWFSLGLTPLFFPEGWDVSEARANVAAMCASDKDSLLLYGFDTASVMNMTSSQGSWPPGASQACPEGLDNPRRPDAFFGKSSAAPFPPYLYYNTIIGGIRIRQERGDPEACSGSVRDSLHNGYCVSDAHYYLKPEIQEAMSFKERYLHSDRPAVYLLSRTPQHEVRQSLRQLENEGWLDPQTMKVELMFITYNPHADVITATFVMLFVNRGGHFHKIVEPVSITLDKYPEWYYYVVDILYILLMVKIFLSEAFEIFQHMKQLGACKGLWVYCNASNLVDWSSVTFAGLMMTYWLWHLDQVQQIKDMLQHARIGAQGTFPDAQMREDFFELIDKCVAQSRIFRNLLAVNPFIIALRFIKAFAAQPRLALMTNTLMAATTDILHFALVFGVIFIVYAFSAMLLFGQELEEFAEFGRAFSTVFRVLVGDFDWERMQRIGRQLAGAWFVSFMCLVNMIMLNMLLAIIMDTYTSVRGSIVNAETLPSQAREIISRKRAVWSGQQISLQAILDILDPSSLDDDDDEDFKDSKEDTLLSVDALLEMVPNLKKPHCEQILTDAYKLELQDNRPDASITENLITINRMSKELEHLSDSVEHLVQIQLESRGEICI